MSNSIQLPKELTHKDVGLMDRKISDVQLIGANLLINFEGAEHLYTDIWAD